MECADEFSPDERRAVFSGLEAEAELFACGACWTGVLTAEGAE
jgi:hypothetical protein